MRTWNLELIWDMEFMILDLERICGGFSRERTYLMQLQ